MKAYDLIEKVKNKNVNLKNMTEEDFDKYWMNLRDEINDFLNGDYPENEKELLKTKGWQALEVVYMMCSGIEYMEEQEKLKQQSK